MEKVFSQIVNKGEIPKNADINDLLESIGAPGEKREEKTEAVKRLFDELGHHGTNFQGHAVWDDLTSWEAY